MTPDLVLTAGLALLVVSVVAAGEPRPRAPRHRGRPDPLLVRAWWGVGSLTSTKESR